MKLLFLALSLFVTCQATGLYDEAVVAFYKDDYAACVAKLDKIGLADNLDVAVLKAHAHLKLGQGHKAQALIDHIQASQIEPIPDFLVYLRCLSAMKSGDASKLKAELAGFSQENDGQVLRSKVTAEYADWLFETSEYKAAITQYKTVIDGPKTEWQSDAMMNLTKLYAYTGQAKLAVKALASLLEADPKHEAIESLVKHIENEFKADQIVALYKPAMQYKLGRSAYLKRAHKRAKKRLKTVVQASNNDRLLAKAYTTLGLSHYLTYEFGAAITAFTKGNPKLVDADMRHKHNYYLARSYQRSRQVRKAAALYQKISKSDQSEFSDDALYQLYHMAQKKSHKKAQGYLAKLSKRDSELANKIIWTESKQLVLTQKWRQAYQRLKRRVSGSEDVKRQAEMSYWQAKSLRYLSQGRQSLPVLKKTIETYPHSYHAFQARQRYFSRLDKQTAEALLDTPKAKLDSRNRWWVRMGLGDVAISTIQFHSQDTQEAVIAQLAGVYQAMGDYYKSIWSVRKPTVGRPYPQRDLEIPLTYHNLVYPRPYWKWVKTYAKRYNLDPNLVLALMREESLFKADIKSSSNAIGLMQIMPATGKEVARKLKIKWRGADMLTNPRINIQIGCFYLSQLMKRFNGNIYHAIGAYNAGPGTMRRWRKQIKTQDIDFFLMKMPYKETAYYVQNVLQSYWVYQLSQTN